MLDVFASMVTDHHFISDHECLHKALGADRALLSVSAVRMPAAVWRKVGQVAGGGCVKLARCTALAEVCQ